MPGFWDWLTGRNRDNRRNTPEPTTTTPTSPAARDNLRNMNYDEGRNAVRPPPAPNTAGPATPTPAPDVAPEPQGPTGEQTIEMPKGEHYTVKAGDIKYNDSATWKHLAEQNGMIAWRLRQANDGVEQLGEGMELYIPSTEEMLYGDCVKKTGDHEKAAKMFGETAEAGGLAILKGARNAASGDMGASYGTKGKDGAFWASNPDLAGASSRRMATHNGEKKYKVIWASNFWKCNLFANESVYQGGREISMRANKHYTTAGALHLDTEVYSQVPAASAYAGCVVQLYGGTGSDASHSGICAGMPMISSDSDGNTVVEFTFLGASTDRAKEADKRIVLKKGTDEILSGDSHSNLRFLKANKKR